MSSGCLKRAFGLPGKWQLPRGLFDVFRNLHEQLRDVLRTATSDELEAARAVCKQLSPILGNPEKWQRGAIADASNVLPWQPIKLAGLLWPSPLTRAITVALTICLVRASKNRFEEVFAAIATAFPRAKS